MIKKHQHPAAVWHNGGCIVSYESFAVGSSAVLRLNICAKIPPILLAENLLQSGCDDHNFLQAKNHTNVK